MTRGAKLSIGLGPNRRQDHIDEALAAFAVRGQSKNVHAIRLDVTDRAAMAAAADESERVFDKLHVLVNNAGVGIPGAHRNAAGTAGRRNCAVREPLWRSQRSAADLVRRERIPPRDQ